LEIIDVSGALKKKHKKCYHWAMGNKDSVIQFQEELTPPNGTIPASLWKNSLGS
jgi:hypothetical protein